VEIGSLVSNNNQNLKKDDQADKEYLGHVRDAEEHIDDGQKDDLWDGVNDGDQGSEYTIESTRLAQAQPDRNCQKHGQRGGSEHATGTRQEVKTEVTP
jgi:hypothetical protein